ncbi:MAG: hypothetical protein M3277_09885 [Actinomycetota bacterium]|nr:hypothetical protein [Actinomycetota bacterium]
MGGEKRVPEYALALNDSIVQGLTAAKMALELGDPDRAERVIDQTLSAARAIIGDLLKEVGADIQPGDLVRRSEERVEKGGPGGDRGRS